MAKLRDLVIIPSVLTRVRFFKPGDLDHDGAIAPLGAAAQIVKFGFVGNSQFIDIEAFPNIARLFDFSKVLVLFAFIRPFFLKFE